MSSLGETLYKPVKPRCYLCKETLREYAYRQTKFFVGHPFKTECGMGMSPESTDKLGVIIPNYCSKCGYYFNIYSGYIFADHKTAACRDCMEAFSIWRFKRNYTKTQTRREKCKLPEYEKIIENKILVLSSSVLKDLRDYMGEKDFKVYIESIVSFKPNRAEIINEQ